MELFFPLIGVFAIAVAAVAATACILVPGPKHLVRHVFFGIVGFIFGGAVCTTIVSVILAVTVENLLPSIHLRDTFLFAFACLAFIMMGTPSAWIAIKFVDSLFESLNFKEGRSVGSTSHTPKSVPPVHDNERR